MLRTLIDRLISESESESIPEVPVLLRILADAGQIVRRSATDDLTVHLPEIEVLLPKSIFNRQQPMSLQSTLSRLHRLASIVRDRISIDTWRIINRIEREFQSPESHGQVDLTDVLALLDRLIIHLLACGGLASQGMTRGPAWMFLDLGRRVELSLQITGLVRSSLVHAPEDETQVLQALIDVRDVKMTYRSRYLASLNVAAVLDLLLVDETNPRSLSSQLVALVEHVENLPHDRSQAVHPAEYRVAMSVLHTIRMADVVPLAETVRQGIRHELDAMLEQIEKELEEFSNELSRKYLIHAGPLRQMDQGELKG